MRVASARSVSLLGQNRRPSRTAPLRRRRYTLPPPTPELKLAWHQQQRKPPPEPRLPRRQQQHKPKQGLRPRPRQQQKKQTARSRRGRRARRRASHLPPTLCCFGRGCPEPKAPSLSPVERRAFRELAQELTARLQGGRDASAAESVANNSPAETIPAEPAEAALVLPAAETVPSESAAAFVSPAAEAIPAEAAPAAIAPPPAEVIPPPGTEATRTAAHSASVAASL